MKRIGALLKSKNLPFFIFVAFVNLIALLLVYRSVFSFELQGDTWQYVWMYKVVYGNTLFNPGTLSALKTSLGGSTLTFALIDNLFGPSAIAYYTISVILKYFSVIAFFVFVFKLTKNKVGSLLASLYLSVTFVGVETTHWVFNMYAYIGMILIICGLTVGLELPEKFSFKKWLMSFFLVALGIWWGPMRTTGAVFIIVAWSLYKFIFLKTFDSRRNFLFWLISLPVLLLVYRTFLGLYEPAYTKFYIWDAWWQYFHQYLGQGKYDFLLSPFSNVGIILLPDQWLSQIPFYNFFPQIFGSTFFRVVGLPMFLAFTAISFFFSRIFEIGRRLFHRMFILGTLWTAFVFVIYKQGPPNFSSWELLMFTLLGGYFLVWNVAFFTLGDRKTFSRDSFFIAFFWSFSFILTPIMQNGGNIFSTLHRYFSVSSAALGFFIAGVFSQSSAKRKTFGKMVLITIILTIIIIHGSFTKRFFDYKAQAHSRTVSEKIWKEFTKIVPNESRYLEDGTTIWFEAESSRDSEMLFESLLFGFPFRVGIKYAWNPHTISLYHRNYDTLLTDVKNNPEIINNFFAIRLENGSLVDITNEMKNDLSQKIEKI